MNLKGLRVYMWMFGFFVHLYMGIWCMTIDAECPWAKSNICKIDIIKKRHCVDLHHFCKPQKFIQLQVPQSNDTILKNPNKRSLVHLITKNCNWNPWVRKLSRFNTSCLARYLLNRIWFCSWMLNNVEKKERVINESLISRNMINVSTQYQLKLLRLYYLL